MKAHLVVLNLMLLGMGLTVGGCSDGTDDPGMDASMTMAGNFVTVEVGCFRNNDPVCDPLAATNPCVSAARCNFPLKRCEIEYAAASTACDDGNAITQNDVCNGSGTCSGSTVNCTDANPMDCVTQMYDVGAAACITVPDRQDDFCEASACTLGETCQGMECTGGVPMDCASAAENECQEGVCMEGDCISRPATSQNGAPCDPPEGPPGEQGMCNEGVCERVNDAGGGT